MNNASTRPLEDLSTFVVEQMPEILSTQGDIDLYSVSEELAAKQLHSDIDPSDSKLALLDSAMLERAVVLSHENVGSNLKALTDRVAHMAQSIPGITYEGLIHVNPLEDDPRVFTTRDTAQSEMLFYDVHRRIERQLAISHCAIQDTVDSGEITVSCQKAIAAIQEGFRTLLQELSPDHFSQMRDYFSNDHRRLPGPSALFSAGICCLDAHVVGHNPDMQMFIEEKMKLASFYPSSTAAEGFCGLSDVRDAQCSGNAPMADADILSGMVRMRSMHLGIAKKFIPEVFAGKGRGTGLTSAVRTFLERPLHIYRKAYEQQ